MRHILHGSATTTETTPSRDITSSREPEIVVQALWKQRENYRQLETAIAAAFRRHARAVRLLSISSAIDDHTSDAFVIAPLFTTAWNRPPDVASDKPKCQKFKR
jgi:hypothetical protein